MSSKVQDRSETLLAPCVRQCEFAHALPSLSCPAAAATVEATAGEGDTTSGAGLAEREVGCAMHQWPVVSYSGPGLTPRTEERTS